MRRDTRESWCISRTCPRKGSSCTHFDIWGDIFEDCSIAERAVFVKRWIQEFIVITDWCKALNCKIHHISLNPVNMYQTILKPFLYCPLKNIALHKVVNRGVVKVWRSYGELFLILIWTVGASTNILISCSFMLQVTILDSAHYPASSKTDWNNRRWCGASSCNHRSDTLATGVRTKLACLHT